MGRHVGKSCSRSTSALGRARGTIAWAVAAPAATGCLSVGDPWLYTAEGYIYPRISTAPLDVPASDPDWPRVERALDDGKLSTFEDGTFRKASPVSLEGLAHLIDRYTQDQGLRNLRQNTGGTRPKEALRLAPERWSTPALKRLIEGGLLVPESLGSDQDLAGSISRIEAARILLRLFPLGLAVSEALGEGKPASPGRRDDGPQKTSPQALRVFADLGPTPPFLRFDVAVTKSPDFVAIGKAAHICPRAGLAFDVPASARFAPDLPLTRITALQWLDELSACYERHKGATARAARAGRSAITGKPTRQNRDEEPGPSVDAHLACDVIISGGTLAALAAALSASRAGSVTCLLEPLDDVAGYWLAAAQPEPESLAALPAAGSYRRWWLKSPAAAPCEGGLICYLPARLAETINEFVKTESKGTLIVVPRSVIESAVTESKPDATPLRRIVTLRTIQQSLARAGKSTSPEKYAFSITGRGLPSPPQFIETSPLGHLLVLSQALWLQGTETEADAAKGKRSQPAASKGDERCDLAFGYPVFLAAPELKPKSSRKAPASSSGSGGRVIGDRLWTPAATLDVLERTRRFRTAGDSFDTLYVFEAGANVYARGSLLLGRLPAASQRDSAKWEGGIHAGSLAAARSQREAWLDFVNQVTGGTIKPIQAFPGGLSMGSFANVAVGRRSLGLQDPNPAAPDSEHSRSQDLEARALDALQLVQPRADFPGLSTCAYTRPSSENAAPDTGPLRIEAAALTNRDVSNLWVAGPTISATLHDAVRASSSDGQWKAGIMAGLLAHHTAHAAQNQPSSKTLSSAPSLLWQERELWRTLLDVNPPEPTPTPPLASEHQGEPAHELKPKP